MSFNDGANIGSGRAGRAGRRGRTGVAVGGGGALLVIGLFVLSQFLGVDLTGLAGGGGDSGSGTSQQLDQCQTGADANASLDCLVKGTAAALDAYWVDEYPALKAGAYHSPAQGVQLFTQSTSTGCGTASSAVGPFYCSADQNIYLDTDFFAELRDRFGASGGQLSEMYVIAHEWGHHIQNLAGVISRASDGDTGPTSNSVRLELQADCYAGAWVGSASTVQDSGGTPFLKPVTDAQIRDALSAASAVGDDRIQAASGQVRPETWTHGSSAQRQKWFLAGLRGSATSCDTFGVGAGAL
ncbi:KPN_02809 family neutral zinc metallopeptidase [Parafrigoribacterium soli]|uniref:KPN_02809 family neutral zinc metallopeptidase n=1 Tax=Parafrigoribacterium soli TaxID=3144663 RepID=UPI0032ED509B